MSNQPDVRKRELLSRSLLFHQLPVPDLDRLVLFAKTKRVAAREVIFHKADPGRQLSAIVTGRVKLSTVSEQGKEMVFGILGPGEFFGEISLLDGEARTATVTAIEPTELLIIERRDFIAFLERHPAVAIRLLGTLALRLRLTNELFEDTIFRNLSARLAKRLLILSESCGEKTSQGTRIRLKLSQQEIGNMISASRESVNKQMRGWEEEGMIKFENGYVTITQLDKLEDLAESFL
jgi:CRP/FNR family transcriptional regulator, cyclic AMP receptor protein